MNDDDYQLMEEESHYYSVLSEMVSLMGEHGSKQVMMDLLELAMQSEVVSKSIN
jgi:hypothetical protein